VEKRVLTVLRSGGEYGPEHVQAIQRQVKKWAPDAHFACLADVPVPGVDVIPLKHDWSNWWVKMELFRPDVPGDFLYTDLDNIILGPIDFAFEKTELTADIGFSFFRMTADVPRAELLLHFSADAPHHMAEWDPATRADGKFGDAAFLRHRCRLEPAAWFQPFVMNIVDMPFEGGRLSCPWRVGLRAIPDGVRVMLCGGKRRRPWLSLSPTIQQAYWCR
jgi:hypothetical protein